MFSLWGVLDEIKSKPVKSNIGFWREHETGMYSNYLWLLSWCIFGFAGLPHEKNLHKMRVLTLMSFGESKSEVSFDDLAEEFNISAEEIEEFVIEGQ